MPALDQWDTGYRSPEWTNARIGSAAWTTTTFRWGGPCHQRWMKSRERAGALLTRTTTSTMFATFLRFWFDRLTIASGMEPDRYALVRLRLGRSGLS